MTIALFIVIAALLIDRWVEHRQHNKFSREQEQAFRLERTALLQRIQNPEIAVVEQADREVAPVPQIPYDDDIAFHEAKRNGSG